jgi:predicted dehydrogenase
MRPGSLSRRGFIDRSAAAMLAAGLPSWFARAAIARQEAQAKPAAGPQIGVIGTGGRGTTIMNEAIRAGAKVVAVADVDRAHREAAAAKAGGASAYADFRELLQKHPEIQAVLIGTTDHWHAISALAAMRSGKDVYCEKPLTLTIAEGRTLVEAARKGDRVFQVGSQQRSNDRFRLACELARNGRLGKITTVETRIGQNPRKGPFATKPVPDGLDWDFWTGPTPETEYVPERCHNTFRWWVEYSGGKLTDWGAHHNDIAQWGLGTDDTGPVRIQAEAIGTPVLEPNSYNHPPDFKVTYTYAKGVNPVCDGAQVICTGAGENGVKFIGADGAWIFVSRGRIGASDPKLLAEPLSVDAIGYEVSPNHMRNFFAAIAGRKRPICDVAIGHRSATVCHLGNISLRLGGKALEWDPQAERFRGDPLADQMLRREPRAPWRLEG